MGSTHVLYIEANPSVYERLQANIESRDNKRAKISMLNRAVSDAPGTLELHLASFDQSSSLLPMSCTERSTHRCSPVAGSPYRPVGLTM